MIFSIKIMEVVEALNYIHRTNTDTNTLKLNKDGNLPCSLGTITKHKKINIYIKKEKLRQKFTLLD